MSGHRNSQLAKPLQEARPVFIEKFDEWKVYQKRCNFAGGHDKTYCRFEGHACAFKLCPMRMYEESFTISTMVTDELDEIKKQLSGIQKGINQIKKAISLEG